jgi:hypothetical protein
MEHPLVPPADAPVLLIFQIQPVPDWHVSIVSTTLTVRTLVMRRRNEWINPIHKQKRENRSKHSANHKRCN